MIRREGFLGCVWIFRRLRFWQHFRGCRPVSIPGGQGILALLGDTLAPGLLRRFGDLLAVAVQKLLAVRPAQVLSGSIHVLGDIMRS